MDRTFCPSFLFFSVNCEPGFSGVALCCCWLSFTILLQQFHLTQPEPHKRFSETWQNAHLVPLAVAFRLGLTSWTGLFHCVQKHWWNETCAPHVLLIVWQLLFSRWCGNCRVFFTTPPSPSRTWNFVARSVVVLMSAGRLNLTARHRFLT